MTKNEKQPKKEENLQKLEDLSIISDDQFNSFVELEQEEGNEKEDLQVMEGRIAERWGLIPHCLPSMTAVKDARHLISLEAEKKTAEEMLQKECAIIPDGTGRKVIGMVGGAMLQVGIH